MSYAENLDYYNKGNLPHNKKIISYSIAIEYIRNLKAQGLTVIYAAGVFDLLHEGHLDFLRRAKSAGDYLFIGLESDETTRIKKGPTRPANKISARLNLISELMSVDFVFPYEDTLQLTGNDEVHIQRFKELNPSYIALSKHNIYIPKIELQSKSAGCEIVVIENHMLDSSTRILKQIGWE